MWRKLGIPCGLLLVLVAAGWSVLENERILTGGQVVRLALAPVDPRSLMQGDYMALNYAVQDRLRDSRPFADGFVVVQVDARGVGTFVRTQPQAVPLSPGEVALRYRVRHDSRRSIRNGLRFATNAFFFEEGSGPRYAQAKYGEFRVGANGEPRLVALLDGELARLGENPY